MYNPATFIFLRQQAMSPLTKKESPIKGKVNIKPFILPVYIILSAVFILYIAYSYATGVVYQSGILSGQEQGQQAWYQAWYEAAIAQLIQQAGSQCEPVSITLREQGVNIINMACLQSAPQANPEDQE